MRLRKAGWLAATLLSMSICGAQALAQPQPGSEPIQEPASVNDTGAVQDAGAAQDPGGLQTPPPVQPAVSDQGAEPVQSQALPVAGGVENPVAQPAPKPVSLDDVRKAFKQRFPELDDDGVANTPFEGLYEIRLGNDVVYTDAGVNFLLQGTLIDAKERVDLTAARLEELSKVEFSSLPLELAVKQVKGDGSRKMAIFEDPNCGYCKQLHKTLKDVDNVTIYSFLFAILTPDSAVKARNIWCAQDKAATWTAWMVDGKKPEQAECEAPIDQVRALGHKLMVQGTPAIFFSDGSRINGAVPADTLNRKLDDIKG
jgi:thiol:disulfide interchange protein DsbC